MKILLFIIEIIGIFYYTLVIIGKIRSCSMSIDDAIILVEDTNVFIRISLFIFLILIGFIPIINFIIATKILYAEIMDTNI